MSGSIFDVIDKQNKPMLGGNFSHNQEEKKINIFDQLDTEDRQFGNQPEIVATQQTDQQKSPTNAEQNSGGVKYDALGKVVYSAVKPFEYAYEKGADLLTGQKFGTHDVDFSGAAANAVNQIDRQILSTAQSGLRSTDIVKKAENLAESTADLFTGSKPGTHDYNFDKVNPFKKADQLIEGAKDKYYPEDIGYRRSEGVGGFAEDVVGGFTQLAPQVALGVMSGGSAVAPTMLGAIEMYGAQYDDLVKEVGHERAQTAAFASAFANSALEKFGLEKVFKAWKPSMKSSTILKNVGVASLSEGMTEFAQKYPEYVMDIWAKSEGKNDQETAEDFFNGLWNATKEAAYEGLIGGVVGGSVAGAGGAMTSASTQREVKKTDAKRTESGDMVRQMNEADLSAYLGQDEFSRIKEAVSARFPQFSGDDITEAVKHHVANNVDERNALLKDVSEENYQRNQQSVKIRQANVPTSELMKIKNDVEVQANLGIDQSDIDWIVEDRMHEEEAIRRFKDAPEQVQNGAIAAVRDMMNTRFMERVAKENEMINRKMDEEVGQYQPQTPQPGMQSSTSRLADEWNQTRNFKQQQDEAYGRKQADSMMNDVVRNTGFSQRAEKPLQLPMTEETANSVQGFELVNNEQAGKRASQQRSNELFKSVFNFIDQNKDRIATEGTPPEQRLLAMDEQSKNSLQGFELVGSTEEAMKRIENHKVQALKDLEEAGYITEKEFNDFRNETFRYRQEWKQQNDKKGAENRSKQLNLDHAAELEDLANIEKTVDPEIIKQATKQAGEVVRENPVYQQMTDVVRSGGIDIDAARQMFSPETIAILNKKRPGLFANVPAGWSKSSMSQIDEVASENGYGSANEMIEAWTGAPTIKSETAKIAKQLHEEWERNSNLQEDNNDGVGNDKNYDKRPTQNESVKVNETPSNRVGDQKTENVSDNWNDTDLAGAYDAAQKNLEMVRQTIAEGHNLVTAPNLVMMNVKTMFGDNPTKLAAPYDGTKEDALLVAKALRLYASEEYAASMSQSETFGTDANGNPVYAFTQGRGETIVEDIGKDEQRNDNKRVDRAGVEPVSQDRTKENTYSPAEIQRTTESNAEKPSSRADERNNSVSGKIDDFGEKIGGARKDTSVSIGPKRAKKDTDDRPAWRKRYQISEIAASSRAGDVGKFQIIDKRLKPGILGSSNRATKKLFDSREEAEEAIPIIAVSKNHRVSLVAGGQRFQIIREVGKYKRIRIVPQEFNSRENAMKYLASHAIDIIETKTSFGEEVLPKPEEVVRTGPERRTGDVDSKVFENVFGFRGVEFGNWNNQEERQEVMNHAHDAMLDLAGVLGVSPKAISLNGELALAFGARGQGLSGAVAHYEPQYAVINLTKMSGAGHLAHEWLHALDHYFGRVDGMASSNKIEDRDGNKIYEIDQKAIKRGERPYISHGFSYKSNMREELRDAWSNVIETMLRKTTDYVENEQRHENYAEKTKEDLQHRLDGLRKDLATEKDRKYWKRNFKAATHEQLKIVDKHIKLIMDGKSGEIETRQNETSRSRYGSWRSSNDSLDAIAEIYKKVRGRSGFNSEKNGKLNNIAAHVSNYHSRLALVEDAKQGKKKQKKINTRYLTDAKEIDKGRVSDYWSTPHEMAARAFSAYVNDKLKGQEAVSDFLVYGTRYGVPTGWGVLPAFPVGEERVIINKAFDDFISKIQQRETENGVALYSKANSEQPTVNENTVQDVENDLIKKLGAGNFKRIQRSGVLEILSSQKNARNTIDRLKYLKFSVADILYSKDGKIQGFSANGKAYLVADGIVDGNAWGVFLHEMGVHVNRLMVGSKELNNIINALQEKSQGNTEEAKAMRNAMDRVPKDTGLREGEVYSELSTERKAQVDRIRAEEAVAYLIENNPEVGIVRRIVALIKRMLVNMGVSPKIFTNDDLTALAVQSVKGTVREQAGDLMYSALGKKWYSRLEQSISDKFPKNAPASANLKTIESWKKKNTLPEPVQEELEWSGLEEYLQAMGDQKVSKQDILSFLSENGVKVEEKVSGISSDKIERIRDDIIRERFRDQWQDGKSGEWGDWVGHSIDTELDDAWNDNTHKVWSVLDKSSDQYLDEFDMDEGSAKDTFLLDAYALDWEDIFQEHQLEALKDEAFYQYYEGLKDENNPENGDIESDVEWEISQQDSGTKYEDYQLPGGENYKELLITMPLSIEKRLYKKYGVESYIDLMRVISDKDDAMLQNAMLGGENGGYHSSHFSEPNILAHIRFNERVDAGGNKVLFLEEIQSDWHQDGRRQGYKGDHQAEKRFNNAKATLFDALKKDDFLGFDHFIDASTAILQHQDFADRWEMSKETALAATEYVSAYNDYHHDYNGRKQPPNAPFKKSWSMLAMKRAIRYASENGFDKIAWTTGDQQAARYDLSKQVNAIEYSTRTNGNYNLNGLDKNDSRFVIGQDIRESEIESYIGKELAKKVINNEGDQVSGIIGNRGVIKGSDLKIGGEGMKSFYDKMLPSQVGRFIKQFSAKVGSISFEDEDNYIVQPFTDNRGKTAYKVIAKHSGATMQTYAKEDLAQKYADQLNGGAKEARKNNSSTLVSSQLGFTITPEMKSSALGKGMPLFSKDSKFKPANINSANFKRWFGSSKITSNGKPHILYHGTNHPQFLQDPDYDWSFDTSRATNQASSPLAGLGAFLGNQTIAEAHSVGTEGTAHPFYVRIENPYTTTSEQLEKVVTDPESARAFKKRLQELNGHDGIIIKDRGQVVVFDPNQLKSAEQNTGEFSMENNDVRYSRQEVSETIISKKLADLSPGLQAIAEEYQKRMKLKGVEIRPPKPRNVVTEGKGREVLEKSRTKAGNISPAQVIKRFQGYEETIAALKNDKLDTVEKLKLFSAYVKKFPPVVRGNYGLEGVPARVADAKTEQAKILILHEAVRKIDKAHEKFTKNRLVGKMKKLIELNLPKLKGGIEKQTSGGYILYKEVRRIKKAMDLDAGEVEARLDQLLLSSAERDLTQDEFLEMRRLSRFGNIKNYSALETKQALEELKRIIFDEKNAWIDEMAAERDRRMVLRNEMVNVISGGKGTKSENEMQKDLKDRAKMARRIKDAMRSIDDRHQSFEWLLDKLSRFDNASGILDSKLVKTFAPLVQKATTVEQSGIASAMIDLQKKMVEIYGVEGKKLQNILDANSVIKENSGVYTYSKSGNQIEEMPLSQNQAYKRWMEWQDESLQEQLISQGHSEATIRDIERFLKPEVMAWAKWQLEEFYPNYYGGVNDVFKKLFYTDMPNNPKYSPIKRRYGKGKEDDQLLINRSPFSSVVNGHIKNRVQNNRDIVLQDGDAVIAQHIAEMEHFKAWGEPMRELRAILGAEDVRTVTEQYHGETAKKELTRFIDDFARGKSGQEVDAPLMQKFRAAFTTAVVGMNPVVFAKQLTSFPAYAMDMPAGEWIKNLGTLNIKAIKTLSQSEMMKARYGVGFERDMIAAMRSNIPGKLSGSRKIADKLMFLTKWGDKIAIITGGWPVYKHNYDKAIRAGKSETEAHDIAISEFEAATERTQQSGNLKDLNTYQRGGPFAQLFTMFMTSPNAYYRQMSGAVRNLTGKRTDKKSAAKRLFIANIVLPTFFQFIASGFDWEDDDIMRAIALSPFNGMIWLREISSSAYDYVAGNRVWNTPGTPPPLTSVEEAGDALRKTKNYLGDYGLNPLEWAYDKDFWEMVQGIGTAVGNVTGVPIGPASRMAEGMYDAATGDSVSPVKRMIGFSENKIDTNNKHYLDLRKKIKDAGKGTPAYRAMLTHEKRRKAMRQNISDLKERGVSAKELSGAHMKLDSINKKFVDKWNNKQQSLQ